MFTFIIEAYRAGFIFLFELIGFAGAIVTIALATSFLMSPMMKFFMHFVRREQRYQAVLAPQIARIKTEIEDPAERHFYLQRLYRCYGYSPILATRKVLPLFVQLPFLFLTYYMLEGATVLNGVRFLCFKDLGAADGLLPLGIHLLPFLMTGINLVAIFATTSFTKKDQIQAMVVAALFLVLLYPASSALMIYWTLNNFFTCVKTLFEEHCAGAKLLWSRLRYLLAPSTARATLHILTHLNPQVYATAALICILFSIYSYMVHHGLYVYSHANFSGRLASNGTLLFAVAALISLGLEIRLIRKHKAFNYLGLLTIGVAVVAFCLYGILLADKTLIHSSILADMHWHYLWQIICVLWGAFAILVFAIRIIAGKSTKSFPCFKDFVITAVVFLGMSCHYLFFNTMLGLDWKAFVGMALGLIGPFGVVGIIGLIFFSKRIPSPLILRLIFVFFLVFYTMPLISTGAGILSPRENCWVQYAFILLGIAVLIPMWKKWPTVLNSFCILLTCFLIGNGIYSFSTTRAKNTSDTPEVKLEHLGHCSIDKKYNLFLLFYDAYPNPTILNAFDIYDPSSYLENLGFTIYKRSYTYPWSTLPSMKEFFDVFSNAPYTERDTITGNIECMKFLQKEGYKTHYVLSPYSLQNTLQALQGDFYFPSPEDQSARIEKILLKNIKNGFLSQSAESFATYSRDEWLQTKRKILGTVDGTPRFLYTHTGPNHAPWQYSNRQSVKQEVENLKSRIEVSKPEMEEDLAAIADWENSIVIVASDHGAGLISGVDPVSAASLLDFYGVYLAIKWPKDYQPTLDLTFSGNVMLEVLICLTGDKTLAQYKRSGLTRPLGLHAIPSGIIDNGQIQEGPNKGRDLFEVAEEELKALSPERMK